MKHLGDITKISGHTAPIVDCIIGGSPCQDLSVAGKRAGLDGERSGLFMEQIRIIKEMRDNDRRNGRSDVDVRPRYMVWENVPGALSSNKGEDFRIVLEETAKVADENASIPRPEKGKWSTSGCILADGWSIAWRVFDAQFWGVPQRRRRIAIVADFGGQSAPEILFVRKSVSGDSDESKQKGQETPTDASGSIGASNQRLIPKTYVTVYKGDGAIGGAKTFTIVGDHENRVTDYTGIVCYRKQSHPRNSEEGQGYEKTDKCDTLNVFDNSETRTPTIVVKYIDTSHADDVVRTDVERTFVAQAVDLTNLTESEVNGTLQASMAHNIHSNNVVRIKYTVRRLTPLECERLQGFPDGWTDIGEYTNSKGKKCKTSDAARYKAIGNSIALPSWKWVLKRLCENCERDATLASLFDGIGGFPLIWEQINGKGSCLWASEIEEFPIAVTKMRIG